MKRFAIIQTASINGSFRNAVDGNLVPTPEGTTLWVRRIGVHRSRSMYGMKRVDTSRDFDKALTWATRETAERKAADLSSDYVTYEMREVEVVEVYPYDRPDAARRKAVEVEGTRRLIGDRWFVFAKVGA